jgi:peptidoglycan/LPS O-acetylase OafA/YrhL
VSVELTYRRDIDGLRAIAVLAVAFEHARIPGFGGGFVGVDVFFVISGYLITQILTREIEQGSFSLLGFYERRIRRIFPALFAVLLVSLAIGCWLLLPHDLAQLARSAVATTFFSANFFYFAQAGYFDDTSWSKPLLHTWSLAVEEQFYIVFPGLLLFARRRLGGRYFAPTLATVLVSFILCAVGTQNYREAAFYLAPMRAWELGLGCLVAVGAERAVLRGTARELAALLGLALIAYSIFHYSERTHFPGFTTIPPVAGAALILWAGIDGSTSVGRALSAGPAVFVGLISYSLYLWHWPLLVYATYFVLRPLTPLEASGVLVVSAALATASWRFVERPFRGSRSSIRTRPLFAAAAALSAATAALGVGISASGGLPQRVDEKVSRYVETRAERDSLTARCSRDESTPSHAPFTRELGDSRAADPSFVVWGDSHACMFSEEIGSLAERDGRRGYFAWGGGCPPMILGPEASARDGCEAASERVLAAVNGDPKLADIVLIARWAYYFDGDGYGHEQAPAAWPVSLGDGDGSEARAAALARALDRTVARLVSAKKRVWIVGPVPEVGWDVPSVLARASLHGWKIDIDPRATEFFARQRSVLEALERLAALPGVHVLYPHPRLCGETTCEVERDGTALYSDDDHVSRAGAEWLAPIFEPLFPSAALGSEPPVDPVTAP